ncbi:MAG: type II secretion system inner membrane protein GspF [Rhodospirillaceae bacterium]
MAAFEYEALDLKGAVKTGVISADTARLARRELRQIRLVPVRLVPVAGKRVSSLPPWLRRERIKPPARMIMTRQLATMISASAPLEEALHTIALQTDDKSVRGTLLAVRGRVMEGHRLADAMSNHGEVFGPLYRALIAAGEMSGNLGPVLERLADYLEKSERLRAKVAAALIYPLVLTLVATGVVVILTTFVVPKVVSQFTSLGHELPLLTRILMFISDAIASYGLAGVVVAGLGVAVGLRALKRPSVRRQADGFVLRLPVIGKLLRGLYAARLTRTLGTLIASGVPVVDGLAAAKSTLSNTVLADAVARATTDIKEGASLSNALRRTNLFPPMVVYMAAVGENTGRLDVMLTKAAEHLENEFETFTSTAIALLEPLIVVVMGGVVALIVLAILMPVLQLNSLALL